MIKCLIKRVLSGIAIKLLDDYRNLAIQRLKIEATRCYLHGVQMARASAIGLMGMGLVIAMIGVGVLLLHAGLFILLPLSVKAKALVGMVLGLLYVIGGGVVLRSAMDERAWMEKSGAAEMLEDAIGQSDKD